MKKEKLVYLKWADATSPDVGAWISKDEILEWAENDSFWIEQVGWILEETDKYILFSSKRSTTKTGEDIIQYGLFLKIPTTWIIERKVINLNKQRK